LTFWSISSWNYSPFLNYISPKYPNIEPLYLISSSFSSSLGGYNVKIHFQSIK